MSVSKAFQEFDEAVIELRDDLDQSAALNNITEQFLMYINSIISYLFLSSY